MRKKTCAEMRGKYAAESIGMSVCVWNCPGRDRRTLDKKEFGQKREKILTLYLAGFLSELAVFQLIAVPVMVKEVLWDEPAGISDNCGFCSVGCDGIYLDASAGTRLAEAGQAKAARCSSKSGASAFLAAVFGVGGLSDVYGLCLCFL